MCSTLPSTQAVTPNTPVDSTPVIRIFPAMSSHSLHVAGLAEASVDQKLALIDELWESVRRSAEIQIRPDHVQELERRVTSVAADPALALTPAQARALLRK